MVVNFETAGTYRSKKLNEICVSFISLKTSNKKNCSDHLLADMKPNYYVYHSFKFLPSLCLFARDSIELVGSDPIERKQIKGTRSSVSSQVFSRFKMTPSAYEGPSDSAMYLRAWDRVRSGHHDLQDIT